MADDVEVEVTGLKELGDTLYNMPENLARAAIRPALNAAGQVFEAAVESTVPRGATGSLAAAVTHKVSVSADLERAVVIVGPKYVGGYKHTSNDPGVRGKFLEFGTRKMAPRFFMRRAYEASKVAAYDVAVTVLKGIVDKLK